VNQIDVVHVSEMKQKNGYWREERAWRKQRSSYMRTDARLVTPWQQTPHLNFS
jgi:hypothetical protein